MDFAPSCNRRRNNNLFSGNAKVQSVDVRWVELDLAGRHIDGTLATLADILEGFVVGEDPIVQDEPTGLPTCI